ISSRSPVPTGRSPVSPDRAACSIRRRLSAVELAEAPSRGRAGSAARPARVLGPEGNAPPSRTSGPSSGVPIERAPLHAASAIAKRLVTTNRVRIVRPPWGATDSRPNAHAGCEGRQLDEGPRDATLVRDHYDFSS